MQAATLLLGSLVLGGVGSGVAGSSPPSPAPLSERDTLENAYQDAAVEHLIERARAARRARSEGLESFEVTYRERIYAGLRGEIVRRERALFHQERAARIHWKKNGDRTIRWLGLRRGVPIIGMRIPLEEEDGAIDDDALDTDFDFLDPAEDRIFLGSDWALHPLADSAALHYRYRSGDTLRIQFAGSDRLVTLVEAIVEPREARFDRIRASLWFDDENAVLVRAAYRPGRDFDLETEEPEDAEEVPGFLRPIRFAVEYITVDYGLQELRWWLPNRMAFDGTVSVGALAEMPVRLEWVFDEYAFDRPDSLDVEPLPEGWTRIVRDARPDSYYEGQRGDRRRLRRRGDRAEDAPEPEAGDAPEPEDAPAAEADSLAEEALPQVVHVIPSEEELLASPELPEPMLGGKAMAFSDDEIAQLKARLDRARAPRPALGGPRFEWGLGPGLIRFNRVEGLSPAVRFSVPTGAHTRFEATARIGVAEWEPHLELAIKRRTFGGSLGLGVYRRLVDVGDWGRPLGFGNTLNTLVFAYDQGMYYRPTGIELTGSRTTGPWRLEGRLFGERHRSARKNTDVTLSNIWTDVELPENIAADRGDFFGLAGRVRVFSGVDPTAPIVSGTAWGEAASGDADYGRLAAQTALATPLLGRLTGALELGAGTTFGSPPTQRLYYLGGPYTLRGFKVGSARGEAFWLARAELGLSFKVVPFEESPVGGGVRLMLFGDAAWAGARDDFGADDYKIGVGAGASFLDGLFRIDLARGVRGGSDWWLHVYADGLL